MSEFDGYQMSRPLHLGTIHGVRSFRLDPKGRLKPVGMTDYYTWKPGENRAKCIGGRNHRAGQLNCACGFYAYWDGENSRHVGFNDYQVEGVIEAWGLITVGTRGFRAEYAKIVALVIPNPANHHWWFCKITHGMSMDAEAFSGLGGLFVALTGFIATILFLILGPREWIYLSAFLMLLGPFIFSLGSHSYSVRSKKTGKVSLLPKLYPDAEIFTTGAEMLKAYPPIHPKLNYKRER